MPLFPFLCTIYLSSETSFSTPLLSNNVSHTFQSISRAGMQLHTLPSGTHKTHSPIARAICIFLFKGRKGDCFNIPLYPAFRFEHNGPFEIRRPLLEALIARDIGGRQRTGNAGCDDSAAIQTAMTSLWY